MHMKDIDLINLPAQDGVLWQRHLNDIDKKANTYCFKVKPLFDEIRYHCDKLELLVDDELWPLVKYREMLFTR